MMEIYRKGVVGVRSFHSRLNLVIALLLLPSLCVGDDTPNTVTGIIAYSGFINPIDLAISNDGSKLLIVDNDANAVFQANLSLNSVDPALTFAITYPTNIVLSPNNNIAYVMSPVTNVVTAFNIATLGVAATISFADQLNAIAIAPDGSRLYVLNTDSGSGMAYISVVTNMLVLTNVIALLGGFQNQADVIISPDGGTLYVSNISSSTITVIDLLTFSQSTISSGDSALDGAAFLAVTPNGETICVANGSNNWTSEVDLTAVPPTAAISANSFNAISYIAITPEGDIAYLSDQNVGVPSNSSVDILDVKSNTVTGSISTGAFLITTPSGITISANGAKGYVANGYDTSNASTGYISIFNTNVIAPLSPAGLQARAQANIFLVQTDLINTITWSPPASGIEPVSYKLYRDAGLTELIATVPAGGVLQYQDHNRQYNTTYSYYVVSVGANGVLSQPASVIVTD